MKAISPDVVARFVVEDWLTVHGRGVAERARLDLAMRIETALRVAVAEERRACVELCDGRQELWRATEEKAGTPASLRAEARSRATEAAWLADALRARG